MDVHVTPAADDTARRALVVALERAEMKRPVSTAYASAWRLAGLREAADEDDDGACYAFSPRSTRGATRA